MFDLYPDHCQIVTDSLHGRRAADEQTLASVAVLSERLKRLKLDERFSAIELSTDVEKLRARPRKVAIG